MGHQPPVFCIYSQLIIAPDDSHDSTPALDCPGSFLVSRLSYLWLPGPHWIPHCRTWPQNPACLWLQVYCLLEPAFPMGKPGYVDNTLHTRIHEVLVNVKTVKDDLVPSLNVPGFPLVSQMKLKPELGKHLPIFTHQVRPV